MLPLHSLRVHDHTWLSEELFSELLAVLDAHPCGIEEIALFSAGVHTPLPLPELRRRVAIMQERMLEARAHGYRAGINLLSTLGHHEEHLDLSLKETYTHITDYQGRVCRGSYCANDARYVEEHVSPTYRALAEAAPDFIWIDDDVRLSGHAPIGVGCYCDGCIAKFNAQHGTDYTRESLVAALESREPTIRQRWLSQNTRTIANLYRRIGKTVRAVNPAIKLGIMSGERYAEGYGFAASAAALSEDGKYEIMWRPGGGAYTDHRFDLTVEKSEQIARQTCYLPPYVSIRQSEIENFPYQLMKKTPTSTALESAMAMVSGCTGSAFNITPAETGERPAVIEPHFAAIERTLPFYRLLSEKIGGAQPIGISVGWRPTDQAATPKNAFHTGYGGEVAASAARELFAAGLPQGFDPDTASAVILSGDAVAFWTPEARESLLRHGVYMNVGALGALNTLGYAEQTGFAAEKEYPIDAREKYLSSRFNEGFVGGLRNGRQAFSPDDSFGLCPTNEAAEVLSSIVDYEGRTLAACTMGVFENALGGRVAVCGYYPFTQCSDTFKTRQLKRMFVYLSHGELPSFVDTYARIQNRTFIKDGRVTVALTNPSNEPLTNLRVAIRSKAKDGTYWDMCAAEHPLPFTETVDVCGYPYTVFTLPTLPPYSMALLQAEERGV